MDEFQNTGTQAFIRGAEMLDDGMWLWQSAFLQFGSLRSRANSASTNRLFWRWIKYGCQR
ncbi:hypothetical protein RP75_28465 [Agrobacterium arsenijevicii]|uniref:Uncharacterized protein n=1 Tax=Agrobacterium arsenijevicii TaxID=1585697 RepID=A0ABR5CZ97_9HYPH|nr:hypothetical protein RP75_28465 [Agrobacterium arsenijevicii]